MCICVYLWFSYGHAVKQFFNPLTEPLGGIWLLMGLGVLWMLWRRQWHSAGWLGGPVVVLFVFGSTPVAEMIVGAAEGWCSASRGEGKS